MSKKLYHSVKGESPVLFENPVVEWLTRCHHLVPVYLFVPVIAFFLYRAIAMVPVAWWQIVLLWLAALAFWTSLEYFIHRFILHYRPNTDFGKKLVYAMHGVHHDFPNDMTRIVLPPSVTIPGGIMFYGLSWLILGPGLADAFFSGLVASYLVYDLNHYAAHHIHWNNKYFRILKQHHLKHHFKDPSSGFGFTTTLWDKLFKTDFEDKR